MQPDVSKFHLLTIHYVIRSLAMSLAGGFVGAYLLRLGFSLAAAVAIYAALYRARFVIRFAATSLVRRLGIRRSLLLGACLGGLQYLPLLHADRPLWLVIWVFTVCVGECVYLPVYHVASAVCAGDGRSGRQKAGRLFVGTSIAYRCFRSPASTLRSARPAWQTALLRWWAPSSACSAAGRSTAATACGFYIW